MPGLASGQRSGHHIRAAQGGVRAPWSPVSGSVDSDAVRGAGDVDQLDRRDCAASLRRVASLAAVLAHFCSVTYLERSIQMCTEGLL